MMPTLTIPSVAAPPRASEAASHPAAEGEGADAFASALQRAQGEPKTAAGNEPRRPTSKSAEAQARTARHAQAQGQAPENAQQPAGDVASDDVAA